MNVLHLASEVAPYAKSGGLGDVVSALPRAQAALSPGDQWVVVAPAYRLEAGRYALTRSPKKITVSLGGAAYDLALLQGPLVGGDDERGAGEDRNRSGDGDARIFLVDHPCYRRDGLYGEAGRDYPDNAFRFALLCRAALEIMRRLVGGADVVHAHDWQAAPALLYAKHGAPSLRGDATVSPRTVLTLHNLAFQGVFPVEEGAAVDFPADELHPEGSEFFGRQSFLKAGILHADRITTVSPTYAREILTAELGCGLDGFLKKRRDRLLGILNGADYAEWDPARDPRLPAPFDSLHLDGKRVCKAALQRAFALPELPAVPLFGVVSRLADQKGIDLLADAVEAQLTARRHGLQLVVLGAGDRALEERLSSLARRHPREVALRLRYDETLAHRVYAGADFFLMPSRYEPCGLGQLYALRYGAIPVVRATGGLVDTVVDDRSDEPDDEIGDAGEPRAASEAGAMGTGLKFREATAEALGDAIRRARSLYADPRALLALRRRGMSQDYSWSSSARRYLELYRSIQ